MMSSILCRLAFVAASMLPIGSTLTIAAPAQTPAGKAATPAPATVSSEPGSTVSTYGDWVLRCQRTGEVEKTARICEVVLAIQVQGQAAPIAQVAIGRLTARDPLRTTVVLPPSVSFPSSVQILIEDKAAPAFELAWRRCFPDGCFADAPGTDEVFKRWRGSTEPGRITFKNAVGQDVTIPLSFRGLTQALDALAREPA